MTDFCPKCGKKAGENEKICSICGEKITSLSPDKKINKRNKIKNKISFINKIIISIIIISLLYIGGNIVSRYFNAGKNIESNRNNQKSELKILKYSGVKEKEEEIHVNEKVKKVEKKSNVEIEKEEITPVLEKKDEYLKIIKNLNEEVEKSANAELDGGEEKLLNYTSKIYKKYDVLLNMIYQDISSKLDSEELQALKEDEILWINKKDEIASNAVGSENTTESDENWVYFDSLVTSTKERCYYLINKYMY